MFVKAQILIAVILVSGTLFAGLPEPATPVAEIVFVALDTETTGFSPKNDRLIEIGAVRFRGNGEILAVTNWMINPGMPIRPQATEVNGITDAMVAGAPPFSAVCPEFVSFCDGSVLLAHNATFDVGFLRAGFARAGVSAPELPILDTLPLFRVWFPQAKSFALEPLAQYLGLQNEMWHRAGADSFHLIDIFKIGVTARPELKFQELERGAGGIKLLNERRN
ncbi:MAG: 3'-5' exonuclease [Kiritimatiellaceae bacterium]|nr:3'-5' exonuclease [Kiritimatiellaceae bacterium]